MEPNNTIPCPFVYANGLCCAGRIYRAHAYGRHHYGTVQESDIKKLRLWCTDKDDHAGAISSNVSKARMEFYPDELAADIYEAALALCDSVEASQEQQEPAPGPDFGWQAPEQRKAEALNQRIVQLWPDEWEATRHMSQTTARKHRKALRERLKAIDKKNAWNTRYHSPDVMSGPVA